MAGSLQEAGEEMLEVGRNYFITLHNFFAIEKAHGDGNQKWEPGVQGTGSRKF